MAQPNKHDSQLAFADGSPVLAKNQGASVTVPTDEASNVIAITAIIERLEEQGLIADN
jgi:hypothetical protein